MFGLRSLAIVAAVTAACSHPPAGTLRFKVEPPVWKVADTTPFKPKPEERVYNRTLYQTDGMFVRRITRAMDLPSTGRALDVNALDEVPDSTWVTNRIGLRDMSVDELRRGANLDPSPINNLPWTIVGAKVGGLSVGFQFADSKGDRYLLKFDEGSRPEMETAAHVIGHALLWAAGYNVPQDYLAFVNREDIHVSPKAKQKDTLGKKSPLTSAHIDLALKKMFRTPDGRYRVLVSRFLPGKPIGPYSREGVRKDDPNDRIAHERRRSVRGEIPMFQWINHTEIQEDNTLDIFKDDHVIHYLIDFGKAFGVMNNSNNWKTVGYTYRLDFGIALRSLLTLGLYDRPWDHIDQPPYTGIAVFEAKNFNPAEWRINSPYWPFDDADRFDGYWGAKITMRFTKEHIAAAVDEAHFTDPRATAYMVDTLVERQRRVGKYWFSQVSPLDNFTVEAAGDRSRLCFDDLARTYQLDMSSAKYSVEVFDRDGKVLEPRATLPTPASGARTCTAPFALGGDAKHYTIVKLAVSRNATALPPVLVHLGQVPRGLDVIGIRRL
ncbi:hypothetical protein BH11MYX3_BH11MYX3_14390 [soil metagenome]